MQWANTSNRYGAIAKFLHWSIVILIIAQYVLAEVAEELPDGIEKLATISRHKSLGMLILGLALLRILWKLMSKGRPSPVPMPAGSWASRRIPWAVATSLRRSEDCRTSWA